MTVISTHNSKKDGTSPWKLFFRFFIYWYILLDTVYLKIMFFYIGIKMLNMGIKRRIKMMKMEQGKGEEMIERINE